MHDPADNEAIIEQLPIPLESVGATLPASGKVDATAAHGKLPPAEEQCTNESQAAFLESKDEGEPGRDSASRLDYSSLLQEKDSGGIEILVQMAQKGDLDPKNIDIIDATDRFLKAIAAAPRENLRQSGKIIFHASVLLRMKAEALLITRIEDLDAVADDFVDFDTEGSPIIFDSNDVAVGRQITLADLQRALVRRSRQKQTRQRRVTLEQLIESLREAERLEKKRMERKEREPKAVIQMDGYQDMQDMDDILELAHDEDIEDVIARIEQMLVKVLEDMLRLSLGEIIKMMDGRGDWVDAFLAVLFLSNAGKLNLEQEIFYGPLFITKNNGADNQSALPAENTINEAGKDQSQDAGRTQATVEDRKPEGKEKKSRRQPKTPKTERSSGKRKSKEDSISDTDPADREEETGALEDFSPPVDDYLDFSADTKLDMSRLKGEE